MPRQGQGWFLPDMPGCLGIASVVGGILMAMFLIFTMGGLLDVNALLQAIQQQQQQQNAGPGSDPNSPAAQRAARNNALGALPDSFIVGGSATTAVSGELTLSEQIQADTLRSEIQAGKAWLGFGDLVGGTGAAEILVTLNESGQDTVTVAQGDLAAIGQDEDCEWNITVSASSVSGTVSCSAVEVWRNATEPTGKTASIHLQFSTMLEPTEGGEGPAEPDDPDGEGEGD